MYSDFVILLRCFGALWMIHLKPCKLQSTLTWPNITRVKFLFLLQYTLDVNTFPSMCMIFTLLWTLYPFCGLMSIEKKVLLMDKILWEDTTATKYKHYKKNFYQNSNRRFLNLNSSFNLAYLLSPSNCWQNWHRLYLFPNCSKSECFYQTFSFLTLKNIIRI